MSLPTIVDPKIDAVPKWMLTLAWMLVVVAAGFGVWWLSTLPHWPLSPVMVLLFALSAAFVWVEKLKWGSVRPFTCVGCLTGWFALILAWWSHADYWFMYMPFGVFVGSLFDAIKLRWL